MPPAQRYPTGAFQSTRPRGARRVRLRRRRLIRGFNPRAREGRDAARPQSTRHTSSFNPRAREGRDAADAWLLLPMTVSIHAPARGATRVIPLSDMAFLFQSTRPRGARRQEERQNRPTFGGFNPRAREGRDMTAQVTLRIFLCFNPRAREGRDLRMESWRETMAQFQSTRPRGARLRSSA